MPTRSPFPYPRIDPDAVLRAIIYNLISNGRSINELLRLIQALQTSDANGVATPEARQPGDKVIVPPPATTEARMNADHECIDGYFRNKSL